MACWRAPSAENLRKLPAGLLDLRVEACRRAGSTSPKSPAPGRKAGLKSAGDGAGPASTAEAADAAELCIAMGAATAEEEDPPARMPAAALSASSAAALLAWYWSHAAAIDPMGPAQMLGPGATDDVVQPKGPGLLWPGPPKAAAAGPGDADLRPSSAVPPGCRWSACLLGEAVRNGLGATIR